MRNVHRWVGTLVAPFALWFAITGTAVQTIDLGTLFSHAPATDPNMMAIRESLDGPPSQAVIRTADFAAPAFADGYDYDGALRRVVATARAAAPGVAFRYVELRAANRDTEGDVQLPGRLLRFSATGTRLPDGVAPGPVHRGSAHDTAKHLHRLSFLGDDMLWINILVGLALGAMILTGLVVYFRLVKARARAKGITFFWSVGGLWRSFHRGVAIVAAAFLLVIAISGVLLSFDSLAFGIYRGLYPEKLVDGFAPRGMVGDYSSPLDNAALPTMLRQTLTAYRASGEVGPIKVVRLRFFAGMPQGIVVAGSDDATRQSIFNAQTGARAGLSGPNYPFTGFPLGWELHEWVKKVHRGDAFGIPGRIMSLLSALSLAFLSVSGAVLYLDLLRRRRRAGRKRLFWV
jgi:uncharacterized iron-regulated membrane protein